MPIFFVARGSCARTVDFGIWQSLDSMAVSCEFSLV